MAGSRGSKSLVVAVTGHTTLGDENAIRLRVNRALIEIRQAANKAVAGLSRHPAEKSADPHARLWLISCLAAGADQLVARAAVDLGYKLQAVLPGHADEYRPTIRFRSDAELEKRCRDEFDSLLRLARDQTTDLAMPLPPGDENEAIRHNSYDAATKFMLRRCDLLIALVNILHRDDLSATGDAVRYAIRAGIPILWIDPARPDQLRWLSHLSEKQYLALENDPKERRVVTPIGPDPDEPASESRAPDAFVSKTLAKKVAWSIQSKHDAFNFRCERLIRNRNIIARAAAKFWDFAIERPLPKTVHLTPISDEESEGLRSRFTAGFWIFLAFIKGLFNRRVPSGVSEKNQFGDAPTIHCVVNEIETARKRARDLAEFYAGAHRSSFLLMTMLGVLAVAIASIPTSTSHAPAPAAEANVSHHEAEAPSRAGKILAAAEFMVILAMIGIYISNRSLKWQDKSMNCRLLAERLRHSGPLVLAGVDPLDTSVLPIQYSMHQSHKSWVTPYFRKLMNRVEDRITAQLGSHAIPTRLLADASTRGPFIKECCGHATHWLTKQAAYQRKTAARYEQLHLMFEFIQVTMLLFTIAICVSHFFAHSGMLSFFASVAPAISAAVGSLALQAELVRLRDRSVSMAHAIDHRRTLLEAIQPKMDDVLLRRFVEETAQEMLSEVSEWRVLFKFRPISSPA